MKITIREAMRIGKDLTYLYNKAINGISLFPIREVKEEHINVTSKEVEESILIEQNETGMEFTNYITTVVQKLRSYKDELEQNISTFNAENKIPSMVQRIKHNENINTRIQTVLSGIKKTKTITRHEENFMVKTTFTSLISKKYIRPFLKEISNSSRVIQKDIDTLNLHEIELSFDMDDIHEIESFINDEL